MVAQDGTVNRSSAIYMCVSVYVCFVPFFLPHLRFSDFAKQDLAGPSNRLAESLAKLLRAENRGGPGEGELKNDIK